MAGIKAIIFDVGGVLIFPRTTRKLRQRYVQYKICKRTENENYFI